MNNCSTTRGCYCTGPHCPQRRRARVRWTLLALLVCLSIGQPAVAQAPPATLPNEYTVKAVFLYSFGRYVQWPPGAFGNAQSPFVIGIVGEDPFGTALDQIAAKKTIQGRPIVVTHYATVDDYRAPCHILFVSKSLSIEQHAAILAKTQREPVLVAGESPGFAESGATANFYVDGDRIRFELNVNSARQSQLRLDAKLLSLGKPIGAPKQQGAN